MQQRFVVLDDWTDFWGSQPALERLRKRGEVTIHTTPAANEDDVVRRLENATVVLANREMDRREARYSFCLVYFDAFWWWGAYMESKFCTRLIEEWEATHLKGRAFCHTSSLQSKHFTIRSVPAITGPCTSSSKSSGPRPPFLVRA